MGVLEWWDGREETRDRASDALHADRREKAPSEPATGAGEKNTAR